MSDSAEQVENNIAQDDNITLSMVVTSMYNQWNLDRAVKAATVPMVYFSVHTNLSQAKKIAKEGTKDVEKLNNSLSFQLNSIK